MGVTALTDRPDWAPEGIDLARPSNARLYDYFLGGAHNFEVDRELAEMITRMTPNIGATMRANRAFLRRLVRFLTAAGIRQFLDIGSGIPTVGNVHEVARADAPDARVVYVDVDPVAVTHSRAILRDDPQTAVIQADLREPERVLAAVHEDGLLDLAAPVALLVLGVLHFVPDEAGPNGIMARLRDAAAAGSYVALSHVTHEDQPPEVLAAFEMSRRTGEEILPRSRAEIAGYFGELVMVEPGLVDIPLWRPEDPADAGGRPERTNAFAGVARKE
jgi:O-methyltransferase involved in polyketide biosynthesis